ncbi:MMPL family transporter [Mucilaginibacter sp. HC2]|uniref:efflux RND transporter permease subunit n=1 Tax=Mucilaginibacter inviolabilis TaxID=2714892 RepID=UPI00140E177A|nr:MMPL family transporter [Mucilaginibacter inviolabilis]NHA06479.1 MMPL family transporter [Mucilaginibacter inviolabilis]
MFWKHTASFILKNRLIVFICVLALSAFMGFEASKVKITFNGGKVLPVTDSAYIRYNQFKQTFGQDASSMVLGIKSDKIFDKDVFNDWFLIGKQLKQINGVKAVVSAANVYNLEKDTLQHRFVVKPLVTGVLPSVQAVDSVKQQLLNLPFYKGVVLSNDGKSTLMAITFDDKIINTPKRVPVINKMLQLGQAFEQKHGIKVHYSGLPLIRTVVGDLVAHEFSMFLGLSILITAIILLIFFRSFFPVIFPVLIVVLGVLWSLGILYMMHYEMTILTGIIPPLVVVIGIPNTIFILNKYYHEFEISGNKMDALAIALEKAGITTFIANITTAIGFGVLCFTNSELLTQFGLVASLGILSTFALSLILVPIVFSYLPAPKKQTGIKDSKWMKALLIKLDTLVHQKRKAIYIITLVLVVISAVGIYHININGYVVDDLPQHNNTLEDLKFFESNFNGVLPLEVSIDTKRKNGVVNQAVIRKVEKLEKLISSYPQFSRSISLIQVLKFSTQAFYGGNPEYYRLPDGLEQNFILNYAANSGKNTSGALNTYLDKDHRITRVTFEMVDAGSKKMNVVLAELQPRIDSIFNPKKFHVELTGSSIIFIKGTNYLLKNLYESLAWAIFLIAGVMWILFRGVKMIAISLVPNLVPLIITAGIMGFFGIPLKPSTILIFSIAMGISSDQTIYFITRYRHELRYTRKGISRIVSDTIRETGVSMIFIATVLFFGFGIFAVSKFGGTVALGILLSITLLVAMISNLTLLPAFLLSLDGGVDRKKIKGPDIEE